MTTMLIHHRVSDYDSWKQVYDSVGDMQRTGGVRSHRVWRSEDDPNLVVVEHTFDSRQAAEAFARSPELQEAMQRAGVDESSVQVEHLEETGSGTF
jgi:heme-degrading monooxygenase HmoA